MLKSTRGMDVKDLVLPGRVSGGHGLGDGRESGRGTGHRRHTAPVVGLMVARRADRGAAEGRGFVARSPTERPFLRRSMLRRAHVNGQKAHTSMGRTTEN